MNDEQDAGQRSGALAMDNGPWGGKGSGGGGGDGGDRNPWRRPAGGGGPRRNQGPSAADQVAERLKQLFGGNLPAGDAGPMIRYGLAALILLWVLFTSFHRIGPQEQGVVTRFGAYAGTLQPGVSFTFPSPIDRVRKVDVQEIKTIDVPSGGGENLILTGDQNLVDLAYSVRWDIRYPEYYLFQLRDPEQTITDVAESAMREVMSTVTLNDAVGAGRSDIENRVARRMQVLLNEYRAGVSVRGVAIKQADPPQKVIEAFKNVTAAQQQKQANINNARTYAQQVIARAQGEAAAFDKVYEQYRLSPEVTRRRMYYETMEAVLANTDKVIVEPNGVVPYMPVNPGRPRVTVEEPR